MCQCQSVNSVPHAPVSLPMSDPDDDGKVAPQLTQLPHSLSFSLCSTFTGTVMRAWSRVPAERQEHQRATNSVHSWSWTCHVTSQLVSTWPASAPAACLPGHSYILTALCCLPQKYKQDSMLFWVKLDFHQVLVGGKVEQFHQI